MLNSVNLIGRLTRDPELQYTPNGVAVTKFTLAVNRNYKNKEGEVDADFIPVEIWRDSAETLAEHVSKGRRIGVEGQLQLDVWENEEGETRSRLKVVANRFHFLDSKREENGKSSAPTNSGGEEDIETPF